MQSGEVVNSFERHHGNSNSREHLAETFLAGSATTFDRRGSAKWTLPFRHSQTLSEAPQVHSQSDLTSEPPKLRPRAPSLMETWKAYNIGIYPCLTLSLNDPESYRNSTEEFILTISAVQGGALTYSISYVGNRYPPPFTGTAVLESLPDGEAFPEIYLKNQTLSIFFK